MRVKDEKHHYGKNLKQKPLKISSNSYVSMQAAAFVAIVRNGLLILNYKSKNNESMNAAWPFLTSARLCQGTHVRNLKNSTCAGLLIFVG